MKFRQPKFRLGQIVYAIEYWAKSHESEPCETCGSVKTTWHESWIFKSKGHIGSIVYFNDNKNRIIYTVDGSYVYETEVFSTKKEAQDECTKRNKENSNE